MTSITPQAEAGGIVVNSIALANFRCFSEARIGLGERTVITGNNGSGKTSIQDALAYVATGACRGTTQDGKGIDIVVRQGEREMLVSADIVGLGTVQRGIGAHVIGSGARKGEIRREPVLAGAADVLRHLGVSRRVFELAVRPDAFSSLHGSDQAAALLELAGAPDLTLEAVLGVGCPALLQQYAEDLDGTLAGYCSAQLRAERDRTEAGRAATTARGAWETAAAEAPAHDMAGHQRADVAAHNAAADLLALRTARQTAVAEHTAHRQAITARVREIEATLARSEAATPDLAALTGERERLTAELAEWREKSGDRTSAQIRGELRETGTLPAPEQIEQQITVATRKRSDARASVETLGQRISTWTPFGQRPQDPDIVEVAGAIERLIAEAGDEGTCYACGQVIDVEAYRAEIERTRAEVEAVRTRQAAWDAENTRYQKTQAEHRQAQAAAASDEPERLAGALGQATRAAELREVLQHAQEAERAETRIAQIDAEVTRGTDDQAQRARRIELQAERDQKRRELDEMAEFCWPRDAELATADALATDRAIALAAHQFAAAAVAEVARLHAAWETLAGKHEALNGLVEAMQGPVREELFGTALRRLTEDLASAMQAVGTTSGGEQLYGADITVDDRGRLQVWLVRTASPPALPASGAGEALRLPAECCSESEQRRLGWALQAVAAFRAGLVVLDAPEALDSRFDAAVYCLGDWLHECGVQVICCAIALPGSLGGLAPAGWDVVDLDSLTPALSPEERETAEAGVAA
jgi:energy-coupling factor transporter ATP-binding protein EcfA2